MRKILFAMMLAGCGAPQHLYVVEPIKAGGGGAAGLFGKLTAAPEPKEGEKKPDSGNWFVRRVYHPDNGKNLIYTVEIIYCPTEKMVFTECRMAVVWSRGTKGGLGPERGFPPSPVPEREPASSSRGTPAGASEAPSDGVETKGRSFFDLSGSEVAQLRGWTGKEVIISLSYGKSVAGSLTTVDQSGVSVDRGGKSVHYRWDEVATVAPAR